MPLSEEAQTTLTRLLTEFDYYAPRCLTILTKEGRLAPFQLNDAQLYAHRALEQQLAATGRVRALLLKGRQQGISTYVQGRFYWKTTTHEGRQAFILTHEQAASAHLYDIAMRYHLCCPEPLRPYADRTNAKELRFANLMSGYKVATAGSKDTGRSNTVHLFHGSESAFWPNAERHLSGVLQTIPPSEGTEIILESTANGAGGVFFNYWTDAKRGSGKYLPIFIPWFWQREYRAEVPADFEADADEQALARQFGLDSAQLQWRRDKIDELKSKDQFKQEYPNTDGEAFLMSGRSCFDPDWRGKARRECWHPRWLMALQGDQFVEQAKGELRVWEKPKPGARYVIGADVAEGLAHGDFSCGDVLMMPEGNQVAQWHGHIAPDRFGVVLKVLGLWYNAALLGVERNNHGLTTLTTLRDLYYPMLYAERDIEHKGTGDKETKKFGWLTTAKSKFKIIDQLAADLRDENHGLACFETVDELDTYVVHQDGHYGAIDCCFDDRVMSRAIAGEMRRAAVGWA